MTEPAAPVPLDLRASVIAAFDKIVADGVVAKAIEDTVAETVTTLVREALGETYRSPFADAVKAAIEQSLAFDVKSLGLPAYNDLLLKVIRRQVNGVLGSTIGKQVAGQVAELLQTPPETYSLRKLVEAYRESLSIRHESGRMKFAIREPESSVLSGYQWIELAPGKDRYGSERHGVTIGTGPEGRVNWLRLDGKDVEKTLFVGELNDFERQLFQLYMAKSRILFDVEPGDVELEYGETCHC